MQKSNSHFDRKVESIIRGLRLGRKRHLQRISLNNAIVVIDYVASAQTEINLSDRYRKDQVMVFYFTISSDEGDLFMMRS